MIIKLRDALQLEINHIEKIITESIDAHQIMHYKENLDDFLRALDFSEEQISNMPFDNTKIRIACYLFDAIILSTDEHNSVDFSKTNFCQKFKKHIRDAIELVSNRYNLSIALKD